MKSPPNIIFIITHDTGKYFGCYSYPIKTPNLDKMAEEGVIFTNHFACAPQCTPSRGGILTGKMPHSNGLMGLTNMGWDLPDYNSTLPKFLKYAGYSTHLVGLQHTHHHPEKLGYDTITPRTDFPHMASTVVRRFKKFMKNLENGEISQPFFCSIGFFETHRSFNGDNYSSFNTFKPKFPARPEEVQIPAPLSEESQEVKEDILDFVSSVKEMDYYIGKIRTLIDNSVIKESTLIIFTVDHGIPIPRHKCTLYDSGISVPLILHMPSEFHGGRRIDDLLSNIDILPTLLDLVGIKIPNDVQGNSFAGLLKEDGNLPYIPRDHIYAELTFHDIGYNAIRCIRTKKWKFIKNLNPLGILFEIPDDTINSKSGRIYLRTHPEYYNKRPKEELYNLESDPLELVNLAGDLNHAYIKRDLNKQLMQYLEKTNDPALKGVIEEPNPPEKGPRRYIYDLEAKK